MIHEHFNAGRGDISQTSVSQVNGEIGRPANGTRSKCVAFKEKRRILQQLDMVMSGELTGYTGKTRRNGSVRDIGSLVRSGRNRTRSEAAARGRGGERRRRGAT
jgi:hypothetical protein